MTLWISIAWLSFCMVAMALELARPFGDHMVLPADRPVPVWGSAPPGQVVKIRFASVQRSTRANSRGIWWVELPGMESSTESRILRVEAGQAAVELEDVLVGEVWLCAGQSNMDFPLSRAVGGREEMVEADQHPEIRLLDLAGVLAGNREFTAAERKRMDPKAYFQGRWQVASSSSSGGFSAIGWWAGKEIHQAKDMPVGLIDISVGGSGAEAWLPREVIEERSDYTTLIGDDWLVNAKIGAWTRERAWVNLSGKGTRHPYQPGFLFEAGVREWREFPLGGVLWYQGETNAEIHDDVWNERLVTDLVCGWRRVLAQPELPFFMVQLPRIGGDDPLRRWWPQFREVQARAAARLDRVVLVKTKDLGWDSPDVHPPDKRPVGGRLGQCAAMGAVE